MIEAGDIPEIHFAPATGARIAYQFFGSGDEIVVSVPPLAQNIEMAWEQPIIRTMLERFGSFARFLIFDKRGTGSSDRTSQMPGLDERVDDLEAVLDHAGVERAHLMGNSEGGPMAILFAASYPDRVRSLVLHGTGARLAPDEIIEANRADPERRYRTAEVWGTSESPIVAHFAPSLAGDASFCEWHQRYERRSATADSIRELTDLIVDMDVRDVLGSIEVPTLVQHRVGDRAVPVEFGRELAARIPGAELIEYEGDDHFSYAGDIDGWLRDMERFITGSIRDRPAAGARSSTLIRTLGRFAVEIDGVEVATSAWGSRLSRQLCKRLVAARGWPVTREQLIDQLWPDETDMGKLGARLSVQLSAVRRVLGRGVVSDRDTVRLDRDQVAVDLEQWMRSDDAEVIVDGYAEFLPEDRYEDWAGAVRDEVRNRYITTLRTMIGHELTEQGDGDAVGAVVNGAVVDLARRLVQVDPYDDRAHRLLIALLRQAGLDSDARRAHAGWADAMAELDIDVPAYDDLGAGPVDAAHVWPALD